MKETCRVYKIKRLRFNYIDVTFDILIIIIFIIPVLFIILSNILLQIKIFTSSAILLGGYFLTKQEFRGLKIYLYLFYSLKFFLRDKIYVFEKRFL